MSRNPENNDARLNYYGVLADTNLFLLLEQEPSNEILEPKFIQLEGKNFALAFDSEESLSEFYGEAAAFAEVTGRVLAKMLLEEKIGLGINLGVSEGELLLPLDIIEWFVNVLDEAPKLVQITPKKFLRAEAIPEVLFKALQEKLMPAVGLFDEIWICAAAQIQISSNNPTAGISFSCSALNRTSGIASARRNFLGVICTNLGASSKTFTNHSIMSNGSNNSPSETPKLIPNPIFSSSSIFAKTRPVTSANAAASP